MTVLRYTLLHCKCLTPFVCVSIHFLFYVPAKSSSFYRYAVGDRKVAETSLLAFGFVKECKLKRRPQRRVHPTVTYAAIPSTNHHWRQCFDQWLVYILREVLSQICSHVDIYCIVSFVLNFDSLPQRNAQAIRPPTAAAMIIPTILFLRNGWILVVSIEKGMLHYVGTTKLNEAVLAIILILYLSLAAVRC